jgi:hypothetical protein
MDSSPARNLPRSRCLQFISFKQLRTSRISVQKVPKVLVQPPGAYLSMAARNSSKDRPNCSVLSALLIMYSSFIPVGDRRTILPY